MSEIRANARIAGRYELADLLEESGVGQFWRGHDHLLNRNVAVHIIPSNDPRAVGVREAARASASLTDLRVLRVLDVADDGGWCYVISEWTTGTSLAMWLNREGPLESVTAAWLVCEVAEALARAHRTEVSHGSLLPEHVVVDQGGRVKIIGFAVAAALQGRPNAGVDSDVTDLAAILYAALTATWAGTGHSQLPAAANNGERVLSPRQVRAGVTKVQDEICKIVLNGPSGQVGRRVWVPYTTAAEIAEALAKEVRSRDKVSRQVAEALQVPQLHSDTMTGGMQAITDPLADPLSATTASTPRSAAHSTSHSTSHSAARPAPDEAPSTEESTSAWAPEEMAAALSDEVLVDGRPLFADDNAREVRPRDAAPTQLPPPERRPQPTQTRRAAASRRRAEPKLPTPGAGWLKLAGVLGIVLSLVVAVLFALWWNKKPPPKPDIPDDTKSRSAGTNRTPALAIASVIDFDPEGEDGENPENVQYAIDGNPATTWYSNSYDQQFGPGGIKNGVGLVLDLGEDMTFSSIDLQLIGEPYTLQVEVGSESPFEPPSDPIFDGSVTAEQNVQFDTPATGRYITLWFTTGVQVSDGRYRVDVAEVKVRG